MNERSALNWQVLDLINDLIAERGLSKTQLVERSGIKRNTLFVKLRGETALTTDDIAKIAGALGAEPEVILRKAWEGRDVDRAGELIVGRFGQNAKPTASDTIDDAGVVETPERHAADKAPLAADVIAVDEDTQDR